MTTRATAETYDESPYEGYAYWFTHPDHLRVMAHAHGLSPTPPASARVLELGCGDGGNLLSLASLYPEATFVGLDLSLVHIETARTTATACALPHVSFVHGDLSDVPANLGPFDYIIAHGVYAWIPDEARDRLLATIASHLAREGVAVVSYNAWPGQHDLEPLRELMRLHCSAIADPAARVRQARNISRLWVKQVASREPELRSAVAERLNQLVEGSSDQILRHDWLSEDEHPVHFAEFCDHAARFGLAWLDNAQPASQRPDNLDEEARDLLLGIPRGVRQQQYLDFFENTRFRVTLLARAASIQAAPAPGSVPEVAGFRLDRMADLSVESRLDFDPWAPESRFRPAVLVETPSGYLEVSGAPLRIALSTLYHHAPSAVPLPILFDEVLDQLVAENQDGGLTTTEEGRARLFGLLLTELVRFWTRELVHFWFEPPVLPSPRRLPRHPTTPSLQRHLARRSRFLPNLAHRHCELDEPRLQLLAALDGSLDRDALSARFGPQTETYLAALASQALLLPE